MPNHRQRKETMDETLEVNQMDSEESLFDDSTVEEEETGLFDDYEPTSEESTEQPTESAPVGESTEVEPTEIPAFLNIKFNGEEKGLTEDEARTLAQKGMNYDRFYEPIERLARLNNMSVGDYVNQLNETQTHYEVFKEMDSLKEDPKYADLPEDVLEEIATSRVKEIIGQKDRDYAEQAQKEADASNERYQREIDMFFNEYPEFKTKGPDSLDPKVFEYVQKGYTLLEAYNKFQREAVNQSQVEMKAKALQKNEDNRKKSIGNTSNAGGVEADPFLAGLE